MAPFYTQVARRLRAAMTDFGLDFAERDVQQQKRRQHWLRGYGSLPAADGWSETATAVLAPALHEAGTLNEVWRFLRQHWAQAPEPAWMALTDVEDSGHWLRLRGAWLRPVSEDSVPWQWLPDTQPIPITPADDPLHPLAVAVRRQDTTFCNTPGPWVDLFEPLLEESATGHRIADTEVGDAQHIFTLPLQAGGRTLAAITLAYRRMTPDTQAQISRLYGIKEPLSQLIWNVLLQEHVTRQARLDGLTGLLTHTSFQQVLEDEVSRARESGQPLTVMLLDVNGMQQINAEHGHRVGDAILRHVAQRLRRVCRGMDTLARFGGDELVLLLPETSADAAREVADRLLATVTEPVPAPLSQLRVSLGWATFPEHLSIDVAVPQQRETLLKLAEQAVHLAKYQGARVGQSMRVSCQDLNQLGEKAILEVFASQVAKKYNRPGLYRLLAEHLDPADPGHTVRPEPEALMLETISSLAGALDAKDKYTRGHSQVVANYAVALAHALQLPAEEVEHVRIAAFLHDIGKIGIPEHILRKPGPLTEDEWAVMKLHPVIGAQQILAPVTALKPIIPMVMHHHERWDGKGYPAGLAGEAIPLGARIVSIVDAFHGLTSDRCYRKALPVAEARKILEGGSGTMWDPDLVQRFCQILSLARPKG